MFNFFSTEKCIDTSDVLSKVNYCDPWSVFNYFIVIALYIFIVFLFGYLVVSIVYNVAVHYFFYEIVKNNLCRIIFAIINLILVPIILYFMFMLHAKPQPEAKQFDVITILLCRLIIVFSFSFQHIKILYKYAKDKIK